MPYWLECSISLITDHERIITDGRFHPATGLAGWGTEWEIWGCTVHYMDAPVLPSWERKRQKGTVETKHAVISFTLQLNLTLFCAVIQHYSTSSVFL